jgi:outer membrane receptor protein involved in Fe transport
MRVKSNKALRRTAQSKTQVSDSQITRRSWAPFSRTGWPGTATNTVAAAVAGILYACAGSAYAQDQTPPAATSAAPAAPLQEVVVTANATEGVRRLDASYNIVSVDAEQIKQMNPTSTADILKVSPGIWPESSGGQTGANIEIAGFPSGGDSPYFTNMIEGLPLYGMPNLSFMDSSSLFRLDDTTERVEVVQGGPSAVFGPGQMGATANFILRRGTAQPSGSVSATYGSEGSRRVDAFFGFPVVDGWNASAGGFYRDSSGVRSPQFPADQGGQFTATLSHDLDDGSLMFWGRALNDKNQFLTPIALVQNANGSFSGYPGFNPLTSTYGSKAIQNVTLPNPAGGFEDADLANGRGGNLYYFGSKYEQKFDGGWNIINNFLFDGGDLNTNALFSGANPRTLGYYLYGCQVPQAAGFCKGGSPVDSNNLSFTVNPGTPGAVTYDANAGKGNIPTGVLNINAAYAGSGATVPLSQSVIQQGWWYIQKTLQNITDEFRVSKTIFDGNTLTGGVYLARYSDDDNWSLGNQMLMTNTPNARPITLNYVQGGHTYFVTSPQGFVSFNGNGGFTEHGNAMNTAGFLSDSWKIDGWLIDAGARLEHIDAHQHTCNTSKQQLGSTFDLWDNAVPTCNGTLDFEHYVRTRPVYTVGANYEITDNMSAYVRANTGVHFDDFDNGIRGASANGHFAPLQTDKNFEFGYKLQSTYGYLDISAYHRTFLGLQFQETVGLTGVPIPGAFSTYGADSKGINLNATITPIEHFNVSVIGNYMNGHYSHNSSCLPHTDINGNAECIGIDGDPLQRQPKFHIIVSPSYTLVPGSWGDITLWVNYEHSGQRFEDQSGLQPLGSYYVLGAGIVANVMDHYEFRIQGTNLTNQIALTEGNARNFGVDTGVGGVLLGRPLEGREVNFTAKYKF